MSPEVITVQPFVVRGLRARTTNAAEQNPASAQIGMLWQNFFAQAGAPDKLPTLYGVYSAYESDWQGAFDVTAGVQASNDKSAAAHQVQVQGGRYLAFKAQGAMPAAVIEAWGQAWAYFSAPGCTTQRAYVSDFEHYLGQGSVAVCIGVKD